MSSFINLVASKPTAENIWSDPTQILKALSRSIKPRGRLRELSTRTVPTSSTHLEIYYFYLCFPGVPEQPLWNSLLIVVVLFLVTCTSVYLYILWHHPTSNHPLHLYPLDAKPHETFGPRNKNHQNRSSIEDSLSYLLHGFQMISR